MKRDISKKVIVYTALIIIFGSIISPSGMMSQGVISSFDNQQELHLLRNEHYLFLKATQNVENFYVRFSFPPEYQYQFPILLQLFNDTSSKLVHYQIENDTNYPNKYINFTIKSINKDEKLLLHFTCWVLIQNHDFSDLPNFVPIPQKDELPEETKLWLESSKVVQKNNILIKLNARRLKGQSDNLIEYAEKVAPFIREHKHLFFILQYYVLHILFSQDAVTTLLINGENVGRSHLACALFRTYDIPSRVLLVHNDQGFWTQMHYMVEYYCPNYGWVLVETTGGKTPYETKRQIINRICYPEDEEDTKTDYIFPTMTGEERWIWIDNDNISPFYVDCDEGSKSQMFSEAISITNTSIAKTSEELTQNIFHYYQQYLGKNLNEYDLQHFQNATNYQNQAIHELMNTSCMELYISFMNLALEEYKLILK